MKIALTDAFKSIWDNKFHFQAHIGPFNSQEEADEFARKVAELEPNAESPPALGISVSEVMIIKDKFG